MGLRKFNTASIQQANKVMHLSAVAYHLKKYLKFTQKRVKSGAGMGFFGLDFIKSLLISDFALMQPFLKSDFHTIGYKKSLRIEA